MDTLALVQFIYDAGKDLLERCESVRQCHSEATRIALRTVRILGALQGASSEFSGRVQCSASLNELKGILVQANELVKVLHWLLFLPPFAADGFEPSCASVRCLCA